MTRFLSSSLVLLALCVTTSISKADYIVLDQIGPVFTPTTYNDGTAALSLIDTSAEPGFPFYQRAAFATTYENFSSGSAGTTTAFQWVGTREDLLLPDPGNNFKISIFADAGGAPPLHPSAPLQTYAVTATPVDLGDGYNLYSANAAFNFAAGTDYWVSVVNELNYNVNGWGLAYSSVTDGVSVQDIGPDVRDPMTRYTDPIGYSMRISAVPEPGSAMLGLVGLGLITFRRRRA